MTSDLESEMLALREKGLTPKQIARKLGLKVSQVNSVIKAAIKAYNEGQAEKRFWWAINTRTLKDLTNCRTSVVENYLKSEEGRSQVADYNALLMRITLRLLVRPRSAVSTA